MDRACGQDLMKLQVSAKWNQNDQLKGFVVVSLATSTEKVQEVYYKNFPISQREGSMGKKKKSK